jgi:uncharacterized membrane protein YGL010W
MNAGTQVTPARFDPDKLRLLVRVGVFVLLVILGRMVFPVLMQPFGGLLVVSALSAFATGALANAVVARGWERGQLSDFGLGWTLAGYGHRLWSRRRGADRNGRSGFANG